MLSQTMLFSFPFVFVRLSLELLILTYLVMGVTNKTSMDRHQGLIVRLVEMIMVIEMKVVGKANVQVLCIRSMSRLFYKPSFKLFFISLTLTL